MRGDVVFKTILRQMRKTLLKEFNKLSKYARMRNKSDEFLIQSLDRFSDKI